MPTSPSPHLLLASRSPRRRRLLAWLGADFDVAHVDTPEDLDSPLAADPEALAVALAVEKAFAARGDGLGTDALVLCFDTIVIHDGAPLGKPRDTADARRMLRSLSGRTHEVVTGCALLCPDDGPPTTFAVTTRVRMLPLTDRRIEDWLAMGEYLGCAGAYNIEEQVAEVTEDECYQNVAGLPLCHLYRELRGPGGIPCAPRGLRSPVKRCDSALDRVCRLGPRLIDARP